jgi:hypothetical protein
MARREDVTAITFLRFLASVASQRDGYHGFSGMAL